MFDPLKAARDYLIGAGEDPASTTPGVTGDNIRAAYSTVSSEDGGDVSGVPLHERGGFTPTKEWDGVSPPARRRPAGLPEIVEARPLNPPDTTQQDRITGWPGISFPVSPAAKKEHARLTAEIEALNRRFAEYDQQAEAVRAVESYDFTDETLRIADRLRSQHVELLRLESQLRGDIGAFFALIDTVERPAAFEAAFDAYHKAQGAMEAKLVKLGYDEANSTLVYGRMPAIVNDFAASHPEVAGLRHKAESIRGDMHASRDWNNDGMRKCQAELEAIRKRSLAGV